MVTTAMAFEPLVNSDLAPVGRSRGPDRSEPRAGAQREPVAPVVAEGGCLLP